MRCTCQNLKPLFTLCASLGVPTVTKTCAAQVQGEWLLIIEKHCFHRSAKLDPSPAPVRENQLGRLLGQVSRTFYFPVSKILIFTGFMFLFLHGDVALSASTQHSHLTCHSVDSTATCKDTNSILHKAGKTRL